MKKIAGITVATMAILSGCAGLQSSTASNAPGASARASSYYCQQERLNSNGDKLECNWQPTAEEACRFGNSSTMTRASVTGDPQQSGRCSSGQWLVKVTPR
jgi:hypothetical protein